MGGVVGMQADETSVRASYLYAMRRNKQCVLNTSTFEIQQLNKNYTYNGIEIVEYVEGSEKMVVKNPETDVFTVVKYSEIKDRLPLIITIDKFIDGIYKDNEINECFEIEFFFTNRFTLEKFILINYFGIFKKEIKPIKWFKVQYTEFVELEAFEKLFFEHFSLSGKESEKVIYNQGELMQYFKNNTTLKINKTEIKNIIEKYKLIYKTHRIFNIVFNEYDFKKGIALYKII